jgi:hypothetical protein
MPNRTIKIGIDAQEQQYIAENVPTGELQGAIGYLSYWAFSGYYDTLNIWARLDHGQFELNASYVQGQVDQERRYIAALWDNAAKRFSFRFVE